jgi:hypothetical protein
MRTLQLASICATAAAAFVLGCSGGGTYHPPLHLDMGNGSGDMAMNTVHDMAMNQGCQFPQQMCNGICTDTSSDSSNCGFCGNVCQGGQFCSNSQCTGGQQPDLAMAGGMGCIDVFNCYVNMMCADQTCFNSCSAMGRLASYGTDAMTLLNCALTAIDPAMNGTNTGPCGGATVCGAMGTQMACNACLYGTCSGTGCTGGQCSTQATQCFVNDT